MRFSDLVGVDDRPNGATAAIRQPVDTDTYSTELGADPRNNGFVSGLLDRRRGQRMTTGRRNFLRGTIAAAAATTAVSAASMFGPARRVEAQSGVVGTYPRRILTFCPPYNSGDNCQPGCGSSPICTDCCGSDGFFRNDPSRGYTLYAGGCGDGDIADGWLWRFKGTCGSCSEIEYRCSDGYVQTDTGPAPFICRTVTECVPLGDGEEAGPALADAARSTNWRPAGALEVVVDQGSSISITGWIADGSGVPVQMRIRANNQIVVIGTASLARPDIARSRPGAGPNTGFGATIPLEPGDYEICVDAMQGVLNSKIGCVRITAGSGASVRGSGATGSITPPASSSPAPTDESGDQSGAAGDAPTPSEVVLPARGPLSDSRTYGAVQVIRRSGETTGFVSGWAGDPDTDESAFIEILVDSVSALVTRTGLARPDVSQAFPEVGSNSGFAVSFTLPADAAEVCVMAISPDDGRRQPLGCLELSTTVRDDDDSREGRPTASGSATTASVVYGGIDSVDIGTVDPVDPDSSDTGSASVVVQGWSFDPNERDRVIAITAQGAGVAQSAKTGLVNAAAQRIYGVDAQCGFRVELDLPVGTHDLTVDAMTSAGAPISIGQQTVVIA